MVNAATSAKATDRAAAGHAESPVVGREGGRLRRLGICVPANLVDRASSIAASRRTSRNAVLKIALERGIGALDAPDQGAGTTGNLIAPMRPPEALEQIRFRIGRDHKRRIEAFAVRKGCRDLSSAIAELVTTALDDEDLGANLPATKADDIDARLVELCDLLGEIGPGVLGMLSLVAHWATQGGGLEVDEDELVDEAWAAGQQAWAVRRETAAADTRHDPHRDRTEDH
jgi:hypothetical protein